MGRNTSRMLAMLALTIFSIVAVPVYAQSYKDVTMSVGETKTLYLPSLVTSKNLKSVTFYSNGISYVQVISYNNYSVTVKALKAFSSPVVVRCDYRYYVSSGSYTYETSGFYDYRITVVGDGNGNSSGVEPTSIQFSSSAVGISVGESRQLSPVVLPVNAEYTLIWSINDNSVATVSQDGVLVGKSPGTTDLKVMADNGVYAMLRVVVSKPSPTSVSVTPSSVTLTEGQSGYLIAAVYPSDANQSVTWSSSDSSIVNVNSIGKITAIKAGTVTITASTSNGKTGICYVTCNEAIPGVVLSDKDGVSDLPAKADVTYERTFYSGWNSVCVPFAISHSMLRSLCEDCKIATVVTLEVIGNNKYLAVSEVQEVDAGEPCLIYVQRDVTCKFSLKGVALSTLPKNKTNFRGAYRRTTIGGNYYKLTNDGSSFGVTKTDEAIVAPFRAYILLDDTIQTRAISEPLEIKLTQVNIDY